MAQPDEAASTALAQRQLDAYNARDLDAFAACFGEQVEARVLGADEVAWRGRAALRERYGPLFAASPALHCRLVSRISMGAFVFDQESVTGRNGDPAETRVVAAYEVRGGEIVRVWFAAPT